MIYDFQHYYNRFKDEKDNYFPRQMSQISSAIKVKQEMIPLTGGIFELGYSKNEFCYDNELPLHKVYLNDYEISNILVTNSEFVEFIESGGYENYRYWLADGWDLVVNENWTSPLYWTFDKGMNQWFKKDFRGYHKIVDDEPVMNVSYYEADAYCKWAKRRLPTEAEWEKAASWDDHNGSKTIYPWGDQPITPEHANVLDAYIWQPSVAGCFPGGKSHCGCYQMIGDVWEWTSSEYTLYPGFESRFEEYTDKWAINQKGTSWGQFCDPWKANS